MSVKDAMTSRLSVFAAAVGSYVYMRVEGTLDASTYQQMRDAVIKVVLDEPTGVVVDVNEVVSPDQMSWAVFTSARWQAHHCAEVPIALVSDDQHVRHLISRLGVSRYVPVYDSFRSATEAIADGSFRYRRRLQIELTGDESSVVRARNFTVDALQNWCMPEPAPVASTVATLLVEDALAVTPADLSLRLESDGLTVTLAVEEKREAHAPVVASGMASVAALCRSCGSMPTPGGRKRWAVIGPENLAPTA